jgi:hypothetical protein
MQKGECTAREGWKKNGGRVEAAGFRGERKEYLHLEKEDLALDAGT